jgi:alanine-synthesizing transaminase
LSTEGEEVLVPSPTYPLYTAVLAKIGAQARPYYRTDHTNNCNPISITSRA